MGRRGIRDEDDPLDSPDDFTVDLRDDFEQAYKCTDCGEEGSARVKNGIPQCSACGSENIVEVD